MKALIALSIILFSFSAHSQPLVYHCQYDTRHGATKQTVDTITSDDGKYAYSVARDIPLTFDIRTTEVIEWYGGTNMSTNTNAIMDQAFQDWEDATGINFLKLGDDDNTIWPIQDGKSQVLIADRDDLRGATALTQRFGSPTVTEADIGFDPNIAGGSTDEFVLSIARHEIGHMIGLQHVTSFNSLMTTTITQGTTKSIDSGSIAGIAFLYSDKVDLDNLKSAYEESVASGLRDTPRPTKAYTLVSDSGSASDLIIRSGSEIYRSTDGGNEWTPISEEDLPVPGVSPNNPNLSYYQIGFAVYKSEDGGQTQTYLADAPSFRTMHAALVLNDFLVWFGTEKGVYKTSDGGQSFLPKNGGLPEEFDARALVQHPSNPSVFYVGGTEGVYKTVNSAANWTPLPKGLGATTVNKIQVTDDGRVYVLTGIGLYRLSDDESEWLRLSDTIGTYGLTGVSIDPANSDEVFISSYFGVFKSQNGGTSFSSITVPELNLAPVLAQQFVTSLALPVETLTIGIDSIATFTDPNDDTLVFSVEGNFNVDATVDGNQISLTGLHAGTTNVRITADDGRGGTVWIFVDVSIAEIGTPVVEQFISTLNIPGGTLTIPVDSIAAFTHPNGIPLSFTVTGNDLINAIIEGNNITLTPLQTGSGQITILADDGRGGNVQASVTVTIEAITIPGAPVIADQFVSNLNILAGTLTIAVDSIVTFSDPDGDPLSFGVIGNEWVNATIEGNTITLIPLKEGSGQITITADDGRGGIVRSLITVTVPEPGVPVVTEQFISFLDMPAGIT